MAWGLCPAVFYIYNRLGPKKLFFLCFLGSSIACFLVAVSTNLISFTLGLALIGALGSVYHPMANALITAKVREYGKALGIHGAVGNLWVGLGSFVLLESSGSYLGWRYTYVCFALPGIVLAIWACFVDMSPDIESQRDPKPIEIRKSYQGISGFTSPCLSFSSIWQTCFTAFAHRGRSLSFRRFSQTDVL